MEREPRLSTKRAVLRQGRVAALGMCLAVAAATAYAGEQPMQRGAMRNPHGNLDIPCSSCHTSTSWKPLRAVPEFDHNRQTSYPLRGMHEDVKCALCHTSLVFSNASTNCATCHADIHRAQFGANCAQCHSVKGWRTAVQTLQAHQNRFPLLGAHAAVECEACHRGAATGVFTGLRTDCYSCHQRQFESNGVVDHRAAGFSVTCETCHNMDTWRVANFDHAQFTGFALAGAHMRLDCVACHVGGRFTGTPADCYTCHVKDWTATSDPPHQAAGFPTDCQACHTTAAWTGAKFDHSAMTRFSLTGAHAQVACASCHVGGRFAGTPSDCAGCHLTDFNKTTNPSHAKLGLSQNCATCHNTAGWQAATFDHSVTGFSLTGAHTTLECARCHVGNSFTSASSTCVGCHLTDFNSANSPNHAAAGFPQDCAVCHTTTQWMGAKFDHGTATKFALTGAHAPLQCAQCHANNVFAGTSTACVGCHLTDFNKTTTPNHVAANLPQDCVACHTTTAWTGAAFDHSKTSFALTGAHQTLDCMRCHIGNNFTSAPTACVGCHLTDFNTAKSPNHLAAGFPQDCVVCHTTTQWTGAKFDHNTSTRFPLVGAHVALQCAQCHANNVFTGTPTACVGCHLTDFNKTTAPNHVAAGFPQDCVACHTATAWTGAVFDHSKTSFALTGAHRTLDCMRCHVGNNFTSAPAACIGCHVTDFNNAKTPNHLAAGFPQDCEVCHTTTRWTGAKFDHNTATKFPLVGAHISLQCAQCHANNVFAGTPTACVGCHLTDFNKTTNPNHVAAGLPRDCVICHTTATWEGAVFDHSRTSFPLTGAHQTLDCLRCHVGNNFTSAPTACSGCHLTDFRTANSPNHVAAGFPQDCSVCHTTTQWTGAKFDHNTATSFPLTGAHATAQCSQCHLNNVFAGTSAACEGCHLTDFNKTTNPNHTAAGFPSGLHRVPHHRHVDRRHLQPLHHRLRPHRRACRRAVRPVPRQRQLQPDFGGLPGLPPDRLQ